MAELPVRTEEVEAVSSRREALAAAIAAVAEARGEVERLDAAVNARAAESGAARAEADPAA